MFIFSKIKLWLALAGGTAIVVAIAMFKAFNAGKALEQAKQAKADKDAHDILTEEQQRQRLKTDEQKREDFEEWERKE